MAGVMTRRLREFAMDFDEIDRPYMCWVWLPLCGFVAFYLVLLSLIRLAGDVPAAAQTKTTIRMSR